MKDVVFSVPSSEFVIIGAPYCKITILNTTIVAVLRDLTHDCPQNTI